VRIRAGARLGYYYFWRAVGTRMGIRNIPESYEAFDAWSRAYEREHCRFAASNQRVGSATRDLFASWFPAVLTPLVRYAIYAMFDDETIAAFGFPRPLPLTRPLLRGALNFTDSPNRTRPDGYRIAELGPQRLVDAERRRQTGEATDRRVSDGTRQRSGSGQ